MVKPDGRLPASDACGRVNRLAWKRAPDSMIKFSFVVPGSLDVASVAAPAPVVGSFPSDVDADTTAEAAEDTSTGSASLNSYVRASMS